MKATPADIQKYLTALEKTTGRITSIAKQIDVILLHEKPDKN
jgi:hypothetical protein